MACLVGALLAGPAMAANLTFTAAGGDWATGANWNLGSVPGSADSAFIQAATTSAAPAYVQSAVPTLYRTEVSGAGSGYLNINTGADLEMVSTGGGERAGFNVLNGTVTQTGGNVYMTNGSDDCYLGIGGGNGTTSTYIMNGGTLAMGRMFMGHSYLTSGASYDSFIMTGGTVTVSPGTGNQDRLGEMQYSHTVFRVSGGTYTSQGGIVMGGTGRDTVLDVSGAAQVAFNGNTGAMNANGTVLLNGSKTGAGTDLVLAFGDRLTTNAGSVIKALIDTAAVATPSSMRKVYTKQYTVNAGSLYDVDFAPGTTPASGTWTILQWTQGGSTPSNLAFAPTVNTNAWSFTVNTTTRLVTVTYNNPATPPQAAVTAPATGFTVGQGQQPVILTATTTNGSPAVVTGVEFFDGVTSLGAGTAGGGNTWNLSWDTTVAFLGAHSITAKATDGGGLQGTSPAIIVNVLMPGDSNADGSVDGLDYNNWQNGYQQPNPTFATGDFNGDGSVDGLDYNVWQNNYNHTATYVADQFVPMAAAGSAPRLVGVTATAGSLALTFGAAVEVGAGAVEFSDGRAAAQSYNAATRTLTVTFAASDAPVDVRVVADFVTADGVALDGEVGDPADPTLPSGDGVAGGDAQLQF